MLKTLLKTTWREYLKCVYVDVNLSETFAIKFQVSYFFEFRKQIISSGWDELPYEDGRC